MVKGKPKKKSSIGIDRRQQESSGFIYEGSMNAIFVCSMEGKILDTNQAAVDLSGYSTKELTELKLDNLFHRDYKHTLPTILDRLTSGESVRLDSLLSRKDGIHVDVEVDISPVEFQDKSCGLAIIRDITERKQVEKRLRENEQRFRQLLDSMSSGVVIYEPVDDGNDFVFLDVNKAAEHIDDLRKEDLEGKSIQVVFPGVHDMGLFEVFQRVYKTGNPEHHPASLYQDERQVGWREYYVFKLRTGEIVAVYDDVTELMKARQELEDSEQKYRDLYDNAPDMFVSVDAETAKIRECNDTLLKALGYQRGEIIGQPIFSVYHPDSLEDAQKSFNTFVETGEVRDTELQLKRKDGSRIDVLLNVSAHRDENGKVLFSRSVWRDITEQKRSQDEKANLEERLQQAQKLESLGVLAGGIAHEFNNLLTTILGNADMARSLTPPASPVSSNLDRIYQASQRAADLVSQMLAYSGKGAFLVRELDLSETIEGIKEILDPMIPDGAKLKFNLATDLPPIKADPAQIRQVVKNLVANAGESLGEKGSFVSVSTGSITIDSTGIPESASFSTLELSEGQYLYIEVADDGEGMETNILQRIYEPFFSTRFAGRGLGLPAVLGIAQGHKGNVMVHSEPGTGTRVTVLLPAAET